MTDSIVVLKFGSSVLKSTADLPTAVHEIYRWYRAGHAVLVVVSALDDATEQLLRLARSIATEPNARATAELLATGERQTAALLAIAVDRAGLPARIVDPREIQFTAVGAADNSEPVAVDRVRLKGFFAEAPILIVPGFFAHDLSGRACLLGRGGSDLSAVFLAQAAGARSCRLLKDVDGVYDRDPAVASECPPSRYETLSYNDALERAAPLIQPKATQFLQRFSAPVEIASIGSPYASVVGSHFPRVTESQRAPPTSVLLLGCGTVGHGVYQRLIALPHHFHLVGVLVRDRAKYLEQGVPSKLLMTLDDAMGCLRPDVVVDLLPGHEPSQSLIRQFLTLGISVVTANKVVAAEHVTLLKTPLPIRYSAAVGGAVPMLESIDREACEHEIAEIEGVVNGTCNFILDQIAEGKGFAEALIEARWRGFCETDPSEDLSGRDSERKLRLLARHAFGLEPNHVAVEELNMASLARAREALRPQQTLRLVANARRASGRPHASVQLKAFDATHPLAQTMGEHNTLVITRNRGASVIVRGRGAGRWPTAEAVIADLYETRFSQLRGGR